MAKLGCWGCHGYMSNVEDTNEYETMIYTEPQMQEILRKDPLTEVLDLDWGVECEYWKCADCKRIIQVYTKTGRVTKVYKPVETVDNDCCINRVCEKMVPLYAYNNKELWDMTEIDVHCKAADLDYGIRYKVYYCAECDMAVVTDKSTGEIIKYYVLETILNTIESQRKMANQ